MAEIREHNQVNTKKGSPQQKLKVCEFMTYSAREAFKRLRTNVMISLDDSDETVADLMTDGCNMGVKSLSKYLNEYKAASEESKDVAKRLIALEEKLAVDMRGYL
jgi:hypothetical protein